MSKKEKDQAVAAPKATLVKARVRPSNNYDGNLAGSIIEVDASELVRVPWCLVSLDQEAEEIEIARKAAEVVPDQSVSDFFDSQKAMHLAQFEAQKQAAALRMEDIAEDNRRRAAQLTGTSQE